MLRSILTLTLRKFRNNFTYSFITLSGLIVGLTTAILVFIWVKYELTYDRYHPDNEKVFTVMMNEILDGNVQTDEATPVPLADLLATGIPEVEAFTRIDNTQGFLTYGTQSVQRYGMYADSGYFDVFHPEMISGDTRNLLPDHHSIVISEELAQLLFKDGDALGKIVTLARVNEFKITGVYSNFPENSSLNEYSFVLPYNARLRDKDEWQNYYVKLTNAEAKEAVEKKIDRKVHEFFGNKNSSSLLFCLTDWRLHWSFQNGKVSGGRITHVVLFSITALFILIMAAVNYVNITTASAAKRAREIGVRKVTGATHTVLIRQFMFESLTITFMAAFISLFAAWILLPLFNQLTGIQLSFSLTDKTVLTALFTIALFTALVAGSYPAFLLSSLKPAMVLKGNSSSLLTGAGLRKALVVFQFTLSVILIFSAVVMRQQTDYLLKKDLGYDRNNVINIWLQPEWNLPLQSFKSEILAHSAVISAGLEGASPMEVNGYSPVKWPGKQSTEEVLLNGVSADHDLLPTLQFKFVAGRNFSTEFVSDTTGFIITEKAAELLGFSDPVGQTITYTMFGEQEGKIIGVVKDFHNEDIHAPIDPVIFAYEKEKYLNNLFVRYADGQMDEAISHVKAVFNKFQPDIPLDYSFLDQDFNDQFYRERLLSKISVWFTVIAIIIAGLGLLGLTLFNAERRTKEIGVRKVLGASVPQVLVLLCSDFFRPVVIAFILAFPPSLYLMKQFLDSYAFRINIPVFTFILVGIVMAVFVLFIVSLQSFRAAIKNPVDSLKSE